MNEKSVYTETRDGTQYITLSLPPVATHNKEEKMGRTNLNPRARRNTVWERPLQGS